MARKQGRYEEARELLERAAATFGDGRGRRGGGGCCTCGHDAAQRGEFPEASRAYEASLEIRERLDDKAGMAALLSNLGVVAEYSGDYGGDRGRINERALALRTQLDDR